MRLELKQVQKVKTFIDTAISLYTDEVYDRFKKIDNKYLYHKYLNQYKTNAGKKAIIVVTKERIK